jgi:hypothetical protein
VPNRVVAKLGDQGAIDIYNSAGNVDVVVDIGAWISGTNHGDSAYPFHPVTPLRLLDSRPDTQVGPYTTPWGPDTSRSVAVRGQGPVSAGAVAVVLNVTGVGASSASYLTVFPGDASSTPVVSDLNLAPGDTLPNLVVVRLGADGRLKIYNNLGSVDVLADVFGWYG